MQDQRHSKRLPVNISLKIESLYRQDHEVLEDLNESIVVQNISKTGIGFEASHELPLNYYFNAHITIDDEKHFFGVLKIIRKDSMEQRYFYGCEFVGLASVLSSYIDEYQKEVETEV